MAEILIVLGFVVLASITFVAFQPRNLGVVDIDSYNLELSDEDVDRFKAKLQTSIQKSRTIDVDGQKVTYTPTPVEYFGNKKKEESTEVRKESSEWVLPHPIYVAPELSPPDTFYNSSSSSNDSYTSPESSSSSYDSGSASSYGSSASDFASDAGGSGYGESY